jgi:hypothetical protein
VSGVVMLVYSKLIEAEFPNELYCAVPKPEKLLPGCSGSEQEQSNIAYPPLVSSELAAALSNLI